MPRRRPVSTGTIAVALAAAFMLGCKRDSASTGPSRVTSKDFASALRTISGDQQIGPVGAALTQQIVVKVLDAGGLPVEGADVTFQVRSGGGSVTPPTNTSAANGLVYAVWTLGTALGVNKVVAILTNNFVLDSVTFTSTAIVGPAATLSMVSGNNQLGTVSRVLAQPLVVVVADQYGHVKSGVKVKWTPDSLAAANVGSIRATSDTTAADGTSTARWTLGTVNLPQTASAAVTGLPPVVFNATTQPDTGRLIVPVSGSGQSAPVGAVLPGALRVRVTDQFGNPIVGENIVWTDSITGGGSVSAATSKSGADGSAAITWTLGTRAGPQVLRAKVPSSGNTFTFNVTATVAFSQVMAGVYSACGVLATNDHIYCWGLNDAGQLGKGNFQNTTVPTTAVSSSPDSSSTSPYIHARQLSGGRSSFCALTTAQEMYCWGRRWGGTGTSNTATLQTILASGNDPFAIDFIAVGDDHACFMNLAGRADCTGVNTEGQIGDGSVASPAANVWVPLAVGTPRFSVISAGSSHTCGMPLFDPSDTVGTRTPWCWGFNNSGQAGSGGAPPFPNILAPTKVVMPGVVGALAFDSASLSAGVAHTCAMTPGGLGYCWGQNAHGQLGKGFAVGQGARDSVPQAVAMPAGIAFARMYAGKYHTCAIGTTGAAYCWGRNDFGQLGDGNRTNFNTGNPSPVAVGGGLMFRSLSLGELYTCGVAAALGSPTGPSASAGTIYCWGDNVFGQIGNGASGGNAPVLSPTRVFFQP